MVMVKKWSGIVCALVLCLSVTSAKAAELTVSAAASLTNAFTQLKGEFEKANAGMTVHTNFAASNPLLKQIVEGAPADVFASADQETMDKAVKAGVISEDTRKTFARNGLVLIVPKDSKLSLKAVTDLSAEGVKRIAVGNTESVPAGRYTKGALEKAGQWDALSSKMVFAESVRQVLDYVARGEADAGFVYTTDAYHAKDKVDIITLVEGVKPIEYPLAVVKSSKDPKMAQAFVDFVCSDAGKAILAEYGFE